MDIGKRIKQRRIELGLSMEQLAKKLGKNRSTVYRYETGEIENMPLDILKPIAEALQTTPAWLMGWEQENIDYIAEVTNDANEYSDSNETEMQNVMIEIAHLGFSSSEIQRLQAYAHALKEAENASNELHKAFIELFTKMYKLDLSIDDLNDVYTYAQFIKSKHQ